MFARRQRSLVKRSKPATHSYKLLEGLESRTLMSVTQPSFANFVTTTGLRGNGFGTTAINDSKHTLQLTDLGNFESRSVFWTQKVPVDSFTSNFSFVATKGQVIADGLTFTVQNYGTNAHGHSGANLGYAGPSLKKSVAAAFNIYNNGGFGSTFGFASGGIQPVTNTDMGSVDLHSGHVFNGVVSYDGATLTVKVTDSTNSRDTFSSSEKINIPKAIGSTSAYVGFTAATGVQVSTQKIISWSYNGNDTPKVTKHAAASPASTTVAKGTSLSVRGSGPGGESTLTYTWTAVTTPTGAKAPKFTANGTNASKATTVKFSHAGRYVFVCTLKDSFGFTVGSNSVVVTVK